MAESIRINTEEYNEEFSRKLKVGDSVLITGKIYSARDAAHKVMTEALARGEKLPIDWTNKFVYYLGPTTAHPGDQIGSAGILVSQKLFNKLFEEVANIPLVLQLPVVWMLIHQQCLIKVSKA